MSVVIEPTLLITGAAGFIGRAAWNHFSNLGWRIIGIDDLSRPQTPRIRPFEGTGDEFYEASILDIEELPLPEVDAVLHLAAQVAVTRSYASPMADFRRNAEGTLRVIEWCRRQSDPIPRFIYASTNKVFGPLDGLEEPIPDDYPLDPATPYGVSKATGALYARELLPWRSFVLHQSCIYGGEQRGSEDQGWVSHVAQEILLGNDITCYGDGTQVRDLLHVQDLLRLYQGILHQDPGDMDGFTLEAGSYVVGGGEENAVTFEQVVNFLGGEIEEYEDWRPKDQRYFVSANQGVREAGWSPDVGWQRGVRHLQKAIQQRLSNYETMDAEGPEGGEGEGGAGADIVDLDGRREGNGSP